MSHLTRSQFETACKILLGSARKGDGSLAQRCLRDWTWEEHPSTSGLGHLSRIVLLPRTSSSSRAPPDLVDEFNSDALIDEADVASLSDPTASDTLTSRQYVVYSPTYRVPVFYFTIHDANGAPLCLNDIVHTPLLRADALPPSEITSFALSPDSAPFPLLSQGDHPVLGTPSWYLHPCETPKAVEEMMAEVRRPQWTDAEYLCHWMRTWFAVLGGVVDLRP